MVGSTVTSEPTETMSTPKPAGIGAVKPPARLPSFASDGDRFFSLSSRLRSRPRARCTICSFTARQPADGSDVMDLLN